jgi:hypothetical protein
MYKAYVSANRAYSDKVERKARISFRTTCCLHGAHQGLGTLSLVILSTYLKLRVLWTVKSPTRQPMALDAFTRAVRALDMNLETTNQPQQSDLR